ncbi:MAG: hypothetical protein K2Q04_07210 [Hyphomicrobium sp.]|nr:hypothetical protein [Hyphomicrobium sp.]
MSKHSIFAVVIGLSALAAPVAADAHCLGLDGVGRGVSGVFDRTTGFVRGVGYRTQRLGDRMFGWLNCGRVL